MYYPPSSKPAVLLLLFVGSFISCHETSQQAIAKTKTPTQSTLQVATPAPESIAILHTDTVYEYEYRTGDKGEYTYNYDVIGADDAGEPITGNVNMQGKYGTGYLTNQAGKKIKVTLEWVGYGELMAEDEEGNVWELGVE